MTLTLSQYWAGPISNIIIILGGILLLYPIIWRLSTKQIFALFNAIEILKKLPDNLNRISSVFDELSKINSEISNLDDKLKSLNDINIQMIKLNRNIDDIQRLSESQLPVLIQKTSQPPVPEIIQFDNWEYVSKTWQEVKDKIELVIETVPKGQRRSKYDRMSRYDYVEVRTALVKDGKLTEEQSSALGRLDEFFRRVRNRRIPVTDEMKSTFEKDSLYILNI